MNTEEIEEIKKNRDMLKDKLKNLIDFFERIDVSNLNKKTFDYVLLYDMRDCGTWSTKEEMIKDIIAKVNEFGCSIKHDSNSKLINIICGHGKVCQVVELIDDGTEPEEFPWSFDEHELPNTDRCDICNIRTSSNREDMIGRLSNYKFNSALKYMDTLKNKESVECLNLLSSMWGNTGWDVGDTWIGELIQFLVDFIILNEGWENED